MKVGVKAVLAGVFSVAMLAGCTGQTGGQADRGQTDQSMGAASTPAPGGARQPASQGGSSGSSGGSSTGSGSSGGSGSGM